MTIPATQDETSLRDLIQMIWRDRWLILGCTLVFGVVAGVAAFLTPRSYRASIVMTESSAGSGGGMGAMGALPSQLGGLASLAGISLRQSGSQAETLAILGSDALMRQFIQDHKLLPELFFDKWDAAAGKWKVTDPKEVPTLPQALRRFRDLIAVDENTKTGIVTLSVTWRDPALTAEWANGLAKLTNDYMRNRTIRHAERNISYLKEQAAQTDVSGVRNAIFSLMESEIKNAMLAKGADEYALTVIDPAVAPDLPWAPRRKVWVIVGVLAGFFLSILVVFLRAAWRRPALV